MGEIIYKNESYMIVGTRLEAENEKGWGFWNRFIRAHSRQFAA
jgi:hypothetical protein